MTLLFQVCLLEKLVTFNSCYRMLRFLIYRPFLLVCMKQDSPRFRFYVQTMPRYFGGKCVMQPQNSKWFQPIYSVSLMIRLFICEVLHILGSNPKGSYVDSAQGCRPYPHCDTSQMGLSQELSAVSVQSVLPQQLFGLSDRAQQSPTLFLLWCKFCSVNNQNDPCVHVTEC